MHHDVEGSIRFEVIARKKGDPLPMLLIEASSDLSDRCVGAQPDLQQTFRNDDDSVRVEAGEFIEDAK